MNWIDFIAYCRNIVIFLSNHFFNKMIKDSNNWAEIKGVKNNLVNASLIAAALAGLPLIFFSLLRSLQYFQYDFLLVNFSVYLYLVVITVFRYRLSFEFKAFNIVILLLILAVADLTNVGILSMSYIWLAAAIILSFLYFNLRIAISTAVFSVVVVIVIKMLYVNGSLVSQIDLNGYAQKSIVVVLRTLSFVLVGAVIVFSMQQITNKFNDYIDTLAEQKDNLVLTTKQIKQEMEQRIISEKAAIESEQKFKNIFETSSDSMLILNSIGKVVGFNSSFLKIAEKSEDEIINSDFLDLVPIDFQDYFRQFKNNIENLPPRFDLNYTSHLSGNVSYLDITTTLIRYEGEQSVLAIIRDNTSKITHERLIYSAALSAEEKERARFSKELHDGLGPLLSTLKIYIEAQKAHPNDEEIKLRIEKILDESIRTVKEVSNNLSPYVLQNLGVVKALKSFIEKIEFAGKLAIKFSSNFDDRLNEQFEIAVYRLVTELIHNTLKHANAQKVQIDMNIENQKLSIIYTDDGIGFDYNTIESTASGIGLFNVKSRIEKLGGNLYIDTGITKGFRLIATLFIH